MFMFVTYNNVHFSYIKKHFSRTMQFNPCVAKDFTNIRVTGK